MKALSTICVALWLAYLALMCRLCEALFWLVVYSRRGIAWALTRLSDAVLWYWSCFAETHAYDATVRQFFAREHVLRLKGDSCL